MNVQSADLTRIEMEICRVVGPAGVEVSTAADDARGQVVRVETSEAAWGMRAGDFLDLLRRMPDRAGVLALRQAVDSDARKLSLD